MKQKAWVVGDDDLDDPCEMDRTLALASNPAGVVSAAPPDTEQKSPVAAFSPSLVVWGGGQFYLGESRPGSIHLASQFCVARPQAPEGPHLSQREGG